MRQPLETIPEFLMIGDWRFNVVSHELDRNGRLIRLEPRVANLLFYLATHAGEPVSRSALLKDLWPDVIVTDEALTNAVNKLRRAFGDDRAKPAVIETIPKTGYRLIVPVRAQVDTPAPPLLNISPLKNGTGTGYGKRVLVSIMVVIGIILSITAILQLNKPSTRPQEPVNTLIGTGTSQPTLAVLPFKNLSPERNKDYLADGITDDMITRLGENPSLVVIARDSSFFYKETSLDPLIIARKLNASHILSGSLQRKTGTLILHVWLTDVASGKHVWSAQYERKPGQIFEILSEISSGVSKSLEVTDTAHADSGKETDNPKAYENLVLGKYHFYRFESRAENLMARSYFEKAVQYDPMFASAHAMLAWTHVFEAMNGWSNDRSASLKKAEKIATHAIEIRPRLPLAYFVRGVSFREQHEYVKSLVEAQRAIEFDRSYANAYVLYATLLYYSGRPQEGLAYVQKAMQINPHHPYNYHFHLGQAYFMLHRYKEAIESFNHGLSSYPASERMRVWLTAALAKSGNIQEAKWQAEQVLLTNPNFSIQRMTQSFPFNNQEDKDLFIDGLKLAGMK